MPKRTPKAPPAIQGLTGADALTALAAMFADQIANSPVSADVDRAQEIMFDAWESGDPAERVALARKALEISQDCADAWTLLGLEEAGSAADALDHFREAVSAGERALGPKGFADYAGHFWGFIETRPYMRARHHLILALWDAGEREAAVADAEGMLALNPNDNQGVRYLLIDWLQRLGRDADAEALLKRYKDDGGPEWLWPKALATFRKAGEGARARKALDTALAANPYVAPLLTGRRKPPKRLPDYVAMGSREQAAACVELFKPTWDETPGAIAWLEACAPRPAARPRVAGKGA